MLDFPCSTKSTMGGPWVKLQADHGWGGGYGWVRGVEALNKLGCRSKAEGRDDQCPADG